MKLTDKKVQSLIKAGQPGRFTDGGGLVLTVNKAGGAYWQWRTTGPTGKETTISYGTYPLVSLAQARDKHRDAKRMKIDGQNPVAVRQQAKALALVKAGNTWGEAASEWLEIMASKWSASHLESRGPGDRPDCPIAVQAGSARQTPKRRRSGAKSTLPRSC